MAHKGHPRCPHTSKAACEKARRTALGPCKALVGDKDPQPCNHLAVDEDGYCGTHLDVLVRKLEGTWMERRLAEKRAELDRRITEFLAFSADHPSVWDTKH